MNKYIITERVGGLGDIFATLIGTWILAKYSNRDVIIDWRRNCYNWHCGGNIQEKRSGPYVPINSFLTIFDIPKSLCGVNFYLPEHISEYGVRNNENNFWEYDDLQLLSQNSSNIEESNSLLFSNDVFIRNEIRFGNLCTGSPINMNLESYFDEKITINNFFEHIKINQLISSKIKFYENLFLNKKVCGIHIRQGNNTEVTNPLRYPNWINDDDLIKNIKRETEQFCKEEYYFFICTDTENINNLILNEIPNSFSLSKDYSYEKEKSLLLNGRINPISSFQQAFLDMYFLTKCSKLLYTRESVFTLIPRYYYNINDKKTIF